MVVGRAGGELGGVLDEGMSGVCSVISSLPQSAVVLGPIWNRRNRFRLFSFLRSFTHFSSVFGFVGCTLH